MKFNNLCALMLFTLGLSVSPRTVLAAEDYGNCTGFITTVPTVITTQGTWCLKQDVATSISTGAAITINTNNVTLNCNNFKLGGLAAGLGTQADGISANSRSNLTVRKCNIRGFYRGVFFVGATGGHTIEDNRFDGNTYAGLVLEGNGSMVQRNRVFDTGGTTQVPQDAYGIIADFSVDLLDNTVSNVVATSGDGGSAFGIYTTSNLSGRIIGNGVRGVLKDGGGTISGIYNAASDRVSLRNNDLVGDAGTGSVGLFCNGSNGRSRDNMISGFASAAIGCNDSGGNAVIP